MKLKGIIFDMDGTLIEPAIDFQAMRRAVGVLDGDILAVLARWDEARRRRALETIEAFEAQAAAQMRLMPGLRELLAWTRDRGVRRAIVTRNNRRTVEALIALVGEPFEPAIDRSFSPPKPDPAALLHVLERWELEPDEVMMVGDSRHDLAAARAAGVRGCLLLQEHNHRHRFDADAVIERLDELIALAEAL